MDKHTGQDLKGRVKEAAGDLLGDESMKLEGKTDQASAAAKRTVDSAVDKAAEAVSPLADKVIDALAPEDEKE
jgi:uncharacterized protein YjbJ (UPF0337 family)